MNPKSALGQYPGIAGLAGNSNAFTDGARVSPMSGSPANLQGLYPQNLNQSFGNFNVSTVYGTSTYPMTMGTPFGTVVGNGVAPMQEFDQTRELRKEQAAALKRFMRREMGDGS